MWHSTTMYVPTRTTNGPERPPCKSQLNLFEMRPWIKWVWVKCEGTDGWFQQQSGEERGWGRSWWSTRPLIDCDVIAWGCHFLFVRCHKRTKFMIEINAIELMLCVSFFWLVAAPNRSSNHCIGFGSNIHHFGGTFTALLMWLVGMSVREDILWRLFFI